MPLLNRKKYELVPLPTGLKPDEEVFFIDFTNEVFRSYEEYVKKVDSYRTEQWSCCFTGKGGLTFVEAQEEEEKALKALAKFPQHLEEVVCRAVHHSTKRVDELVTSIHSTLRPAPDGSQQDLAPTGERAQGSISPFGSKENKDGTQQQGTAAASATPAEGKPAAKAPKGSKAPISRPLLRTFIIKHAEQKGPEGATKLAWVMSPELAAKYQLPADLPEAVALELAASVKAPKKRPNAEAQPVLSPASGQKKSKTAPESAKASATTGPSTATGEGKTDDSAVLTPVTAKPLHEVEKQYAEGTVKRYIVEVLKAVRPQGLSVQQVMDKGKELSIKEFEPKHRNQISQALIMDPNFCRLEKGLYSLHAFHPDVKVFAKPPAPRKRPAEDGAAGDWSKLQRVTSEGEVPAAGAKERGMEGGGDQEVDDLAQAEKVLRNAKAALARHQAALDRAATSHEEAKAAFEESKKSSKAPSKQARRNSDFHIPPEALAQFEVKEEEREFTGDADDRKGMLEHRQKLQARVRELEKAKKEFIEEQRAKHEEALKESLVDVKSHESVLRKAEKALDSARTAVEAAERAVATAERRLQQEQKRAEKRAEKAEKEQRKKYPIDDLELLEDVKAAAAAAGGAGQPALDPDVHQPTWLPGEEGARLANALYVSDIFNQFGRALGIKALNFVELEKLLQSAAECAGKGSAAGADGGPAALHAAYYRALHLILEDLKEQKMATAAERRWLSLLSDGTWPEVLRRLVLTRASYDQPYAHPSKPATMAASMMAFDGADELTYDQHMALLSFLADEILDSGRMRTILQKREDDAQDAKRDIREDMAEERRRLRELDEAEKEERRKKREEERLKQENEAAAVEGQQDASTAAAPATAERSFELPERLKEYKGDPEDEKALLAFRQEQQAEKRRLDKERSRWMGEQLRRQREEEALAKQAKEAELAKQREREAAEDALARAQEALEEKMEKLALRRAPLGLDRQYRRYWWGIGAHRPALYVEDAQGKWGVISSAEDLQALMASLDRRGVRELALAQAIEKKLDVMELAMRRAGMGAGAADKTRDKWTKEERPAPMRQSSRQSRQPEFFVPSADAGKPQSGGGSGVAKHAPSAALVALNMGVSELTSFEEAVDTLLSIQQGAAEADIEGPGPKGWTQWVTEVSWAGKGKVVRDGDDKATPAASAALLRNTLHIKAIELEACLAAASDEPERDDEETSDGEEGPSAAEGANGKGSRAGEETDADDGPRPSESLKVLESVDATFTSPAKLPKDIRQLWRTARERALWQADVGQAGTSARLAYLVAVLELQAAPLLRTLRRTVHGPTPVAVKKQAGSKKVKPAPGKATKKEEPFRERPEGARRCARHMTT